MGYNYKSTITNSYATGDVSATATSSSSYARAGGLVGWNYSSTITNSYATGDVSATASSSAYAGGLVGINSGTITNSYATGDVSATASSYAYAGGLVGGYNNSGTITNCHRYSGQVIKINDTVSSSNSEGTAQSLSTFQSESFCVNTLSWPTAEWCFPTGSFPMLASITPNFVDSVKITLFDWDNKSLLREKMITVNGVEYVTDINGCVEVRGLAGSITIYANGFDDYKFGSECITEDNIKIYLHHVKTTTEPCISSVMMRKSGDTTWVDVGNTEYKVENDPKNLYDISITVNWNGFTRDDAEELVYLATANGKSLTKATDSNIVKFENVALSEVFSPDQDIYAYCVGFKKTEEQEFITGDRYNTKIKIQRPKGELGTSVDAVSLFGKNGVKLTLDDDIPILGGSEISISGLNLPVTFDIDDEGMVRMTVGLGSIGSSVGSDGSKTNMYDLLGVGMEETVSSKSTKSEKTNAWNAYKSLLDEVESFGNSVDKYKKISKSAKKFKTNKKISVWGTSVDVNALGYIEGRVTSKGFVFTAVNIQVAINASGSRTWQYALAPIPVPFYVEIGFEGGLKVTVSWNREAAGVVSQTASDWDFEVQLSPSLAISLGIGVGIAKWLAVGLEGKAQYDANIRFVDKSIDHGITLTAFIKADAFLFHWEKEFAKYEKRWYATLKDGSKGENSMNCDISEAFKSENYTELAPRDYIDSMKWLGSKAGSKTAVKNAAYTSQILQENIYENSEQKLVEVNGTKILFWLMDNADRDSQNRTMLVYSVYDETENTWSKPVAVDDDGTADFMPEVVTDGNNVYIVWQNMNKAFASDVELNDFSAAAEIVCAEYDPETGSIIKTALTSDKKYDSLPTVSAHDGKVIVAWVTNSACSALFEDGTNTVNYRIYDGAWGSTQVAASDVSTVMNLKAGCDETGCYIAYAVDPDGDMTDREDNEIILVKVGSEVTTYNVTDNETLDSAPQFITMGGEMALYWYSDANIHKLDLSDMSETTLFEENIIGSDYFDMVSNDSGKAYMIFSLSNADEHTMLYASIFDGENWSTPVPIGKADGKVINPSAVVNADGTLTVAYNDVKQIEEGDEDFSYFVDGSTDLCVMTVNCYTDMAVYDESIIISNDDIYPGNTFEVPVTVVNKGMTDIDSVDIYVDGEKTETQTVDLKPGESKEIAVKYTLGDSVSRTTAVIKVVPSSGDANEDDNTVSFTYGYTELSVKNPEIATDDLYNLISATIENESSIDSGAFTVNIHENDLNGEIVYSETFDGLTSGETVDVMYLVSLADVDYGTLDYKSYYFEIVTDQEEYNKGNNTTYVYFTKDETSGLSYGVLGTLTDSVNTTVAGFVKNNDYTPVSGVNVLVELLNADKEVVATRILKVDLAAKELFNVTELFDATIEFDSASIRLVDDVFTVTFKDGVTDEVIDEYLVVSGATIVFPEVPEHDGYTFIGWSCDEIHITQDTVIIAQYRKNSLTGDVNGDDEVNTIDALLLLRHIAGWNISIDEVAADINGDGEVNTIDALLLLRYIAGWNIAYFN